MPDRVHNVEGQAWGGERVLTLGRKLDPYHEKARSEKHF